MTTMMVVTYILNLSSFLVISIPFDTLSSLALCAVLFVLLPSGEGIKFLLS